MRLWKSVCACIFSIGLVQAMNGSVFANEDVTEGNEVTIQDRWMVGGVMAGVAILSLKPSSLKYARVMGKKMIKKHTGIYIQDVGLLRSADAGKKHGQGYPGIRYRENEGKMVSWELHTPHNNHGFHFQKNHWSLHRKKYEGEWIRYTKGVGIPRVTLLDWPDWE